MTEKKEAEPQFSKSDFMNSPSTKATERIIYNCILEDGQMYTATQAKELLEKFKGGF